MFGEEFGSRLARHLSTEVGKSGHMVVKNYQNV